MDIEYVRNDEAFIESCKRLSLNHKNSICIKNAVYVYDEVNDLFLLFDRSYTLIGSAHFYPEDINFKRVCQKFGINNYDFYIYGEILALLAPTKNLYVLVDLDCQILDIVKCKQEALLEVCFKRNELYNTRGILVQGNMFCDILKNLSLKDIMRISSSIQVLTYYEGSADYIYLVLNGKKYVIKKDNSKIQLLCLIKYIGEIASFFLEQIYPLHVMRMVSVYGDIYEYIKKILSTIEKTINLKTSDGVPLISSKFLDLLGQGAKRDDFKVLLEGVFGLYENGYNKIEMLECLKNLLTNVGTNKILGSDDFEKLFKNRGF